MKLNIDPAELRRKTQDAIEEAKRIEELRAAQEAQEKKRKDEQDEIRAKSILERLPDICARATTAKKTSIIAMRLGTNDYEKMGFSGSGEHDKLVPEELRGAAIHVWNACKDAGLNPKLDYWWSGDGVDSGFNIVICW